MKQLLKSTLLFSTLFLFSCSEEQAQEQNIQKSTSEVQTPTITKTETIN